MLDILPASAVGLIYQACIGSHLLRPRYLAVFLFDAVITDCGQFMIETIFCYLLYFAHHLKILHNPDVL